MFFKKGLVDVEQYERIKVIINSYFKIEENFLDFTKEPNEDCAELFEKVGISTHEVEKFDEEASFETPCMCF